jgi:hypothetical protein
VAALLASCGGFLLAVLWMDLMFDVQVLRYKDANRELPEEVLSSTAAYYRRVTTGARPMGYAIALVMLLTIVFVIAEIASRPFVWLGWISLLLVGGPVVLALLRVYPNAVRLGSRADSPLGQSALARSICRDHLLCFASMLAFVIARAA